MKNLVKVLFHISDSQVKYKGKKFKNNNEDRSSESSSTKKAQSKSIKPNPDSAEIKDAVSHETLEIKKPQYEE